MKRVLLPLFGLILFFSAGNALAADVEIFIPSNQETVTIQPFGEEYRGSASVSAADLGTDGVSEIVVGSGPGLKPEVQIFRKDGSLIRSFLAYHENFRGGVNVALCDLNGDGANEIVTGTLQSGGPHVRAFRGTGEPLAEFDFFAYAEDFRGGVNVACADVDGDGVAEIISGAGLTGGPHVRLFDAQGTLLSETFIGSASENSGAIVTTADVDGDGLSEIIASRMAPGATDVVVLSAASRQLRFLSSLPNIEGNDSGILLSAADVDSDGKDEIGIAQKNLETPAIRFFELTGQELTPVATVKDSVHELHATPLEDNDSNGLILFSTSRRDSDQIGKYIYVDVSEQRLYAYENGILVHSFLISSGTYQFPTPLGKTEVLAKLPVHDYVWSYGPGNPNNYNLPGVKWNLRFRSHYYLHSAYWHNNFGHRMSHGCVNIDLKNAEWIYNWADVGTPVEIAA